MATKTINLFVCDWCGREQEIPYGKKADAAFVSVTTTNPWGRDDCERLSLCRPCGEEVSNFLKTKERRG